MTSDLINTENTCFASCRIKKRKEAQVKSYCYTLRLDITLYQLQNANKKKC